MRVFAVALDGPLAKYEWGFIDYLNEMYPDLDINPELPSDDWGIPLGKLDLHREKFNNSAQLINGLQCNEEAAEQMRQWSFEGLVPSVFVARRTETRMVTEMWLTKYCVPYSNLLFDTLYSEPSLLRHIDASFYVDTDILNCLRVAVTGIRTYFLIDEFNHQYEKYVPRYSKQHMLLDGMLKVAHSFDDIRKHEGINGKL